MKRIIAMMLALVMVFALCACGNNTSNDDKQKADDSVKTLTVGVDPEYPPYAYMGDDGKYTGFDVEVSAGRWRSSLSTGIRSSLSSTQKNATASGPA